MSRLKVLTKDKAQQTVEVLYKDLERRIVASPPGLCPVDFTLSFLGLCHSQTCGKCVPCRIGLGQLQNLVRDVLEHRGTMETLDLITKTAKNIMDSADCAIGYEAANMVLKGLSGFREEYVGHIVTGKCSAQLNKPVPCVALCPAGVDIPGYIALVKERRYADAVRLIRKDNPFPVACALICEHPCEARCRRNMIDDSINIRGLKRFAVDKAGVVLPPKTAEKTGKRIAIVGGGPGGLSAAYYLALMGHQVVVYERETKLGGMLRYGIPNYRFPRERLQEDIDTILSVGVEVKFGISIGDTITFEALRKQYDAVYISIGAHTDKKVGISGEESEGVISAVEMLKNIGNDNMPDFTGKEVIVIGAGNVAMDCTRSAIRLGAKTVRVVYRRRKEDMTALHEEVEGAVAEGAELLTLKSPVRIEKDANNKACALWVKSQIIGAIDGSGRAKPYSSLEEEIRIPCDTIIVAIGQGIEFGHFKDEGIPIKQGVFQVGEDTEIIKSPGIFAGGDCVTGPSTVICAIAAGKVAAANIDNYLGYNHLISVDVMIPEAEIDDKPACGRVNMKEKEVSKRKDNFQEFEGGMSEQEAYQEASRCLRCDHFGYGALKGGRDSIW